MAATEKGVWDLQEVRDKQLASEWTYTWGGTLWAWGWNPSGILGQNNKTRRSSPTQIGTSASWSYVGGSGPGYYANGIKSDGTLWGWGGPGKSIGINSNAQYSSPIQIGTSTDWKMVSKGGEANTAAIKTDGTMWVWGSNESGKLGLNIGGDPAPVQATPLQLGTDTNWKFCSMSKRHALAIKTDGTIWGWGRGNSGGLGLNNNNQVSSPTQIGTNTNWKTIVSRTYGGAAINTSGQLFSWGYNSVGQVGDNTQGSHVSSPKQIPGSWAFVDTGGDSMQSVMGLKTNGTMWAWGTASKGQIDSNLYGNNSGRSSPVQIGTETTWSTADNENNGNTGMMQHSACNAAMKTDGTWWTWGSNNYGNLGQNDHTGSPNYGVGSPKQLPGSWKFIGVSEQAMWGIK